MMNSNKEKLTIDLSNAANISDLGMKITDVLESNGAENKILHLNLGSIDLKQSQLLSIKALIEAMQSSLEGIETTSEMTENSAMGLGLSVGKPQISNPSFSEQFNLQVEESYEEKAISSSDNSEELNSFAQLKKMNSIGDFVTDTKTLAEIQDENLEKETQEFLDEADSEDAEEAKELTKEEKVANIYDSLDKEMTHEDIQDALDVTFGKSISEVNAKLNSVEEHPNEDIKHEEIKNEEPENSFTPIQEDDKFNEYESTDMVEKSEEKKYVLLDTEGITPEGIELIKSNTSDLDTLYLTQTLRSGQTVSYEGNIFLIGDAHPGSEINATGDITVWGILGGIVHAGAKGNTDAKVRALKLNPIQLRIANLYSRRNDTVNVPYVQKSNEFTPEEARIEKEQIVIYKTLRRED